jgi:hypothetical protein
MISLPRKCIWLTNTLTWLMVKCEVKSWHTEQPSGLTSIEFLGDLKVLEVLVVCPDFNGVVSAFEVVSPFLKSSNNGEHLIIVDLIILLYSVQHFQSGCRALSLQDCCDRTTLVAMTKSLASSWNRRLSSGSTRTVTEVMKIMKKSSWGRPLDEPNILHGKIK